LRAIWCVQPTESTNDPKRLMRCSGKNYKNSKEDFKLPRLKLHLSREFVDVF